MIEGKNKAERWKKVLKNPKLLKEVLFNISPEQQLRSQLVCYRGNMFGLAFAWFFLILKGLWFFSISMFFVIGLQLIGYIGVRKQYLQAQQMKQEAENSKIFKMLEGRK